MDEDFLLNCGILPPFQHEQLPSLSVTMPTFHPLFNELNSPASEFLLDSAISSMAPSPSAWNQHLIKDNFMIRGRLGNICNSNGSNETSCYNTPMSSPHRINFPLMEDFTNLGNSVLELPALAATDPAAKVSFSGSRSFNGWASGFGENSICTLHRISSSPVLNATRELMKMEILPGGIRLTNLDENRDPGRSELHNLTENSSLSGRNNTGDHNGVKHGKDLSSRKRKANNRGKVQEDATTIPGGTNEVIENVVEDDRGTRRAKKNEGGRDQGGNGNQEKDKEDAGKKQCSNGNQKQSEPPKDYIHVRARRGQATDSHSLAERVRREKISERMKLLQDLVPGCNKVTGKALMLDEIINYVQSLQKQVEFLSMKLAIVNPKMEFNLEGHFKNKMSQPSCSLPQQAYPLDSSSTSRVYCGLQPLQNILQPNITSKTMSPCSMEPMHGTLNLDNHIQLPPIDGLNHDVPQDRNKTPLVNKVSNKFNKEP